MRTCGCNLKKFSSCGRLCLKYCTRAERGPWYRVQLWLVGSFPSPFAVTVLPVDIFSVQPFHSVLTYGIGDVLPKAGEPVGQVQSVWCYLATNREIFLENFYWTGSFLTYLGSTVQ